MKLKVLGSSSHGNCYILESPTGSLLLEAGVPWPQIQKGLDFDLSAIVGCLISHEHKDHCKAVIEVMTAGIDVYTSKGTIDCLGIFGNHRINLFCVNQKQWSQLIIRDFIILPFATEHDAVEPLGFIIYYRPTGEKLLFATDTYFLHNRFNELNYILIECNYCKDILDHNIEAGLIDEGIKRRLLESHFSLEHVKEFLKANDLSQCRKIILLHLSDGNSDAARMVREIQELTGIDTVVAEPGLEVELELYPY
jgi:phosphoribosyl 1,2-cyclic phosphodiesterase